MVLTDWNNHLAEVQAPGVKARTLDVDSLLINGHGSYLDRKSGEYTYAPMAAFYVERGKRHRFRIDNAASLNCPFEFSVCVTFFPFAFSTNQMFSWIKVPFILLSRFMA